MATLGCAARRQVSRRSMFQSRGRNPLTGLLPIVPACHRRSSDHTMSDRSKERVTRSNGFSLPPLPNWRYHHRGIRELLVLLTHRERLQSRKTPYPYGVAPVPHLSARMKPGTLLSLMVSWHFAGRRELKSTGKKCRKRWKILQCPDDAACFLNKPGNVYVVTSP